MTAMKFTIYRYNPDADSKPYMQDFVLDEAEVKPGMMLLDALLLLKAQDESLSFRRSCGTDTTDAGHAGGPRPDC